MIGQSIIALLRRVNTWVAAQTFSAASTFNALVTATAGMATNALTFNSSVVENMIVRRHRATYTASADLTTAIPHDDTVPTVSEGTQIITYAYTPKKSGNKLRLRFNGDGGVTVAAIMNATLHVDGGAAVAIGSMTNQAGANMYGVTFEYEHTFASGAAVTFSVRAGASTGTTRMNGISTARRYGGICACVLDMEEIG